MGARRVRVAAGQMLVEGGAVEANLRRAEQMIHRASAAGCAIVVLPECLDVGWTDPSARDLAEPIPGYRVDRLGRAAAEGRIAVVAGCTERSGPSLFNSAVLIENDGRLLMWHRKINVLEIAQDLYAVGDRLQVATTKTGVVGVNICADNFPNTLDIGMVLGRLGAQLLLSPSAWAVDGDCDVSTTPYGALWREAYGRLAKQFRMPVIGASNVGPITGGPWAGRRCVGCSLVVDANGQPIAEGPPDAPALVVGEVTIYDDRPRGTAISGML